MTSAAIFTRFSTDFAEAVLVAISLCLCDFESRDFIARFEIAVIATLQFGRLSVCVLCVCVVLFFSWVRKIPQNSRQFLAKFPCKELRKRHQRAAAGSQGRKLSSFFGNDIKHHVAEQEMPVGMQKCCSHVPSPAREGGDFI